MKYCVGNPPFITQNCWSFNNIFMYFMKLTPKTKLFKTHNKKSRSKESKAFSRSIVTKNPGIFSLTQISLMSDTSPPLSLMHCFSTYAVWFEEIIDGKMGLSFAAKAFDNIFVSTLSSQIGPQFLRNRLFRSFFRLVL